LYQLADEVFNFDHYNGQEKNLKGLLMEEGGQTKYGAVLNNPDRFEEL